MEIPLVGSALLGTAIGERLLARGYRLHVWNRRQEHAQTLVATGAQLASSPAEAVAEGELVITVLGSRPVLTVLGG
jgi:2-hydroxy-3-oxopropionate reductase